MIAVGVSPEAPPWPPIARPIEFVPRKDIPSDNPMRLESVSTARCVINLVLATGLFFLFQIILSAAIVTPGVIEGELLDELQPDITVMIPIGLLVVVGIVVLLRVQCISLASIGLTWRRLLTEMAWGIPAAAISISAFVGYMAIAQVYFPDSLKGLERNVDNIAAMLPEGGLLTLAGVMLCVVFYEEVYFRGLVLTHLRRIFRSWTAAVVVAAIFFASLHSTQDSAVIVPLSLMAVIWSIFAIWRRSLVPAMVAHFIFNYGQLVSLYLLEPGSAVGEKLRSAGDLLVRSMMLC